MRVLPRVIVIGAGFGGLQCARKLRDAPVDVVLVDRQNYHLFTPLLYQVASCLLSPGEIAAPLRKVFRGASNVRVRQGEVARIDFDAKSVYLTDGDVLEYDYVVVAAGSRVNFFGNDDLAMHALGLKDLPHALQLRNHVLSCLERATVSDDDEERERLLTFCIAGGGPTGVEYAGALAELVRLVLPLEYPEIAPSSVRIVLLEGSDRLLSMFRPRLSEYARRELARRGVDVRLNTLLASATDKEVVTRDGATIPTNSLIWTAGVTPADVPTTPHVPHLANHRYEVDTHCRIRGVSGAYAIGDAAAVRDRRGRELPMTSPPAMQAGRYVARDILKGSDNHGSFRYYDKGTLATIGRTSAVGEIGPLRFTGFIGWIVWLVVHLYYLIGFENRAFVMARWSWYYLRYDRPIRVNVKALPNRE
jgi:NADH dehydrogenase